MGPVAESESVRKTDKAETFIVEKAEGSPSTEMCQGDRDSGPDLTQEGPFDVDVEYRLRGNTLYINIPLVPQGPSKM